MRIVRQSDFKAVPWKNGGGATHEALREPPTGTQFRWRVSVARIAASGPFSNFAGYRRLMVLLQGKGVRLDFGPSKCSELREVGDLVQFDGATAPGCELLDGPCTDLNLMVAESLPVCDARVESLLEPRTLQPLRDTLLVFPIAHPLLLEYAGGGAPHILEGWDLAVLSPGETPVLLTATGAGRTAPLVFLARLNDN